MVFHPPFLFGQSVEDISAWRDVLKKPVIPVRSLVWSGAQTDRRILPIQPTDFDADSGMYEKLFGFHGKPFQSAMAERNYFRSESVEEVLPAVLHSLQTDLGIAVLTGPAGIGKTAFLKHVRSILRKDSQVLLTSAGSIPTVAHLFGLLYRSLNRSQSADRADRSASAVAAVERWQLVERLGQVAELWGPSILLLDDAHLAEANLLAAMRSLLEEEANGQQVFRLMIAGPLSLEESLARPAVSDFAQKIRSHGFLQPLRSRESVQYLEAQLGTVGANLADVFQPEAVERIVVAAEGVPRNLNLLADECLMVSCDLDQKPVSVQCVDTALRRLQHLPYSWNIAVSSDYGESDDIDSEVDNQQSFQGAGGDAERDSVVEIGGSGVVEIGAGSSVSAAADDRQARPTSIEVGVIEIGGPADDGEVCADGSGYELAGSDAACADEAESASDWLELEPVNRAEDVAEDAVEWAFDTACDSEDASDCPDDLEQSATAATGQRNTFEPWNPPGQWPAVASQGVRQQADRTLVPADVEAVPVFDRYTWRELELEIADDHEEENVLVFPDVQAVAWPPELEGVAPATVIPIIDDDNPSSVLIVQEYRPSDTADAGQPESKDMPDNGVAASSQQVDEEPHRDQILRFVPQSSEAQSEQPTTADSLESAAAETATDADVVSESDEADVQSAATEDCAASDIDCDADGRDEAAGSKDVVSRSVVHSPPQYFQAWNDGQLLGIVTADESLGEYIREASRHKVPVVDAQQQPPVPVPDSEAQSAVADVEAGAGSEKELPVQAEQTETVIPSAAIQQDSLHTAGQRAGRQDSASSPSGRQVPGSHKLAEEDGGLPPIGRTLFTLPIAIDDLNTVTAQRGSKGDDVEPLADSVLQLQDEVRRFNRADGGAGPSASQSGMVGTPQPGRLVTHQDGSGTASQQPEQHLKEQTLHLASLQEHVRPLNRPVPIQLTTLGGLKKAAGAESISPSQDVSGDDTVQADSGSRRHRLSVVDRLQLEVSMIRLRDAQRKQR
jgi:type II secretory pathway predicted ATPase ExeA